MYAKCHNFAPKSGNFTLFAIKMLMSLYKTKFLIGQKFGHLCVFNKDVTEI